MFKKILFIFILLLISTNVKAINYDGQIIKGDIIPNIYIKKEKDGVLRREYAQFLLRTIIPRGNPQKAVYCVQPWEKINNDTPYQILENNIQNNLNISDEKWLKIQLYANYGYMYQYHFAQHWYIATQYLIWKEVDPNTNIYFTDQLVGGNVITPYENEIKELTNIVNDHLIKPSFDNQKIIINLGEEVNLIDTNNKLSKYKLKDTDLKIEKVNNNLKITDLNSGNYEIELYRKDGFFNEKINLYTNSISQNVINIGDYTPIIAKLNIVVTSGKIRINKLDFDTKSNEIIENYSLKDAEYEIRQDDNFIGTYKTNEFGIIETADLPLGKYQIKEITPSKGYQLDENIYDIELKENQEIVDINIYEKKEIKKEIDVQENVITEMPITSGYDNKYIFILIVLVLSLIKNTIYEKN